MRFAIVAALMLCAAPAWGQSIRDLFRAIQQVESGGDSSAVGDGGRSIGPYQIQWAYWKDSGVPGKYRQVRDPKYAERVMLAYWKRYCPKSLARGDLKTLARVHNGGLRGHRKPQTLSYWRKVQKAMRAEERDGTS
ncbi:MAG: hypothetical protein AMXMBFR13_13150 [Phycisphaerae bacterium]|jgi:hypothetical protein